MNSAQSALARRVRQGSTGPAPLPLDSTPTQSGCCTDLAAPTDHIGTPRPAGCGEWGWSEGAPGQYQSGPLPLDSTPTQYLILTQSLHPKYTCGKRAV